jgi:hypothetical protein
VRDFFEEVFQLALRGGLWPKAWRWSLEVKTPRSTLCSSMYIYLQTYITYLCRGGRVGGDVVPLKTFDPLKTLSSAPSGQWDRSSTSRSPWLCWKPKYRLLKNPRVDVMITKVYLHTMVHKIGISFKKAMFYFTEIFISQFCAAFLTDLYQLQIK